MISILSWTTKKHKKILSRPVHSKLKKISRTFQDCANPACPSTQTGPLSTELTGWQLMPPQVS